MVPINYDYDLYSAGKDGQSVSPSSGHHRAGRPCYGPQGGFVGWRKTLRRRTRLKIEGDPAGKVARPSRPVRALRLPSRAGTGGTRLEPGASCDRSIAAQLTKDSQKLRAEHRRTVLLGRKVQRIALNLRDGQLPAAKSSRTLSACIGPDPYRYGRPKPVPLLGTALSWPRSATPLALTWRRASRPGGSNPVPARRPGVMRVRWSNASRSDRTSALVAELTRTQMWGAIDSFSSTRPWRADAAGQVFCSQPDRRVVRTGWRQVGTGRTIRRRAIRSEGHD